MPAEIIDAIDRFRMPAALRYTGDDPGLLAASKLALHAGLASRVRCMILNGSSDETVDLYIDGWLEAGSSDGGGLC